MLSTPVPLPDLYFDSFSSPVASIVFGDMAIVSLFLLLFFSQSQILSEKGIGSPASWFMAGFICTSDAVKPRRISKIGHNLDGK